MSKADPSLPAAPPRPERVAAFRAGLSAESRAALLLLCKGYRIVARRWKTSVGEIDLIARRGRSLVFIEVKTRQRLDDAAESLSEGQRRRIVAAAHVWLGRHPTDATADIRFDVILVAPCRWPRHIQSAFDASR
jgi:putative endonuclease